MYEKFGSPRGQNPSRQLVLADNYRLSPVHNTHARESVYDAPKRVTMDGNRPTKTPDKETIRSSVHEALAKELS